MMGRGKGVFLFHPLLSSYLSQGDIGTSDCGRGLLVELSWSLLFSVFSYIFNLDGAQNE